MLFWSCRKAEEAIPTENLPSYYTFSGLIGTNDNSTIVLNDNDIVICGNTNKGASILKISNQGKQVWRKYFSNSNPNFISGIVQAPNQNYFLCGSILKDNSTSNWDMWLIKTNSGGDTVWTKTFGDSAIDYGNQIINTQDGNILLCGITRSVLSQSYPDIYLIKVDYNGDTLWTRTYPDEDQEIPFHLLETQNGEYLVTGTNIDTGQPIQLYYLKVNSSGDVIWDKKIGSADSRYGLSTIELSNGNLLTCGMQLLSNNKSRLLVEKTDNLGNVIWEKNFGDSILSGIGNSIKKNADNTFTIVGSSFESSGKSDIILLKFDSNGNQLLFKKFGGSENDYGKNLIKDHGDGNIITGNYYGSIFMLKTDRDGKFLIL